MTAALAVGRAAGVPAAAVAELLPAIEAAMVRQMNKREAGQDGD
jgi:hypothetical protein